MNAYKENVNAPWINFEAGALSKSLDKANVSPFLIDIKRSDVQGPLVQFQSVLFEKDDLFKLISSINNRIAEKNRLTEALLERAFEVWWPHLESHLKELERTAEAPKSVPAQIDEKTKILEELLELARQQQRILNSPEALLPPGYLEFVVSRAAEHRPEVDRRFQRDYMVLHEEVVRLERILSSLAPSSPEVAEAARMADRLHDHLHALERGVPRRVRSRVVERSIDEGKKE